MASKRISIKHVIAAIKKNGYPWTKNSAFRSDGSSCVLGQAVRNLWPELNDDTGNYREMREEIDTAMWKLCDELTFADDGTYWRDVRLSEHLEYVGNKIFSNNDAPETSSYKEAADYAVEILTPYIDREITIDLG